MPQIVTVNATIAVAPSPNNLQRTGAFVSQGGTSLSAGTYALLTQQSSLAEYVAYAMPLSTGTPLSWSSEVVTATTAAPHGFRVGDTLLVDIAGAVPLAYNGTFTVTVTGASTFTYPLISNPGANTTTGTYVPTSATQLNQMNTTFWGQGSIVPVYVLELGPGNVDDGVAMLEAFIAANSSPQFFYSYLVPRYWDGAPSFLSLIAQYEDPSGKTYFHVTTTLQNYTAYTALMKDVIATIEAPAMGTWASNAVTELLAAPAGATLSSSVAGSLSATTYYVRITYMTAYGESPTSLETNEAVPSNSVLVVDSPSAMTGATGWNVYVGTTSGTETLQNSTPLSIGSNWTEPTSGLVSGALYQARGFAVATTTSAHGVAIGQWFQLIGFTPTGYNNWYQALGGTQTNELVFYMTKDDLGPETVLGHLAASLSSQAAAPTAGNTGEFTAAAGFYKTLGYNPSSANLLTPFAFSFLFGVTPWTTQGNSAVLQTLKDASVNVVLTGAEGGITDTALFWGTTMDGSDFMEWYGADWIQIQLDLSLSNAIINGSNNPLNPLYYSQFGIETLQDVALGTCRNGVSFGCGNGTVVPSSLTGTALQAAIENGTFDGDIVVNAVPFVQYLEGSPGDYKIGRYAGLGVLWIVNRGFIEIQVNLSISNLPVA